MACDANIARHLSIATANPCNFAATLASPGSNAPSKVSVTKLERTAATTTTLPPPEPEEEEVGRAAALGGVPGVGPDVTGVAQAALPADAGAADVVRFGLDDDLRGIDSTLIVGDGHAQRDRARGRGDDRGGSGIRAHNGRRVDRRRDHRPGIRGDSSGRRPRHWPRR